MAMSADEPSERAASPTNFISRLTARLMLGAIKIGIWVDEHFQVSPLDSASKPVVPTTRGIFRVRQHSAIAGAADGSEKSIMTSIADVGGQDVQSKTPRGRDASQRGGIVAEAGMAVALQRRGQLELWVLGDELDQARAHATRSTMDADGKNRSRHGRSIPLSQDAAASTRFPEYRAIVRMMSSRSLATTTGRLAKPARWTPRLPSTWSN